jgi:hypothetical protein
MTQHLSEVIRERLGWCPNHVKTAAQPAKMGSGVYIIAAFCVLIMAAAVPLLTIPASQDVMVWAFQVDDSGYRNFVAMLPATEDASGNLLFSAAGAATPALPAGKYWLVTEHPNNDGSFRLTLEGNTVISPSPYAVDEDLTLFRLSGPGSLRGEDAYEMLIAAFNAESPFPELRDQTGAFGAVTEREYIVE